ncbi:zinc finger protein 394-like isoform X2 [Dermacentor albipictus]|uniref:zinc finger protein 394-like isoform X2 n=1 Tax=Dermacentor albipictus TaxID=60249 RepID=UPI0038FCDB3C
MYRIDILLRYLIATPVRLELFTQPGLNEGGHLLQHTVYDDVATSHISKRPRKCSYCGKGFKRKFDLDKHMRVHTGEKPFCCHLCPMTFTQKQSVSRHMRTHTDLAAEPVWLELSPQQSLNKGKHLPQHLVCNIVKSSRRRKQPRKCSYCGKEFKQKVDLDKHVVELQ